MMKMFLMTALLVLAVTGCADDALTSADGEGCANPGEFACFDDALHRCGNYDGSRSTWVVSKMCPDLGDNCSCVIDSGGGIGWCGVNGNAEVPCE